MLRYISFVWRQSELCIFRCVTSVYALFLFMIISIQIGNNIAVNIFYREVFKMNKIIELKPTPNEEELYKKMYYHLFNAVLDAIKAEDKATADMILMRAQTETEEMYIEG